MRPTPIIVTAALLLAAACGDEGIEKTWDQEIILQLFKSKAVQFSKLTVHASSGASQAKTLEVNKEGGLFASCESNRIRIIPRPDGSAWPEVTIKVTNATPFGAMTLAQAKVKVPVAEAVKLVLAKGKDLEPAACAPSVTLDALGDACTRDSDCQHGTCLKSVKDDAGTYTFVDGYCSASCDNTIACPAGSQCATFGLLGQPAKKFCLKKCPSGMMDCRAAQGYKCSGSGVCLPEPVK